MEIPFPAEELLETAHWGRFLGDEWRRDFPDQLHDGRGLVDDGTPQRWHASFAAWLSAVPDHEQRHRTTKVMRKLRRAAPREYEVLYRMMILGESVEDTTRWLNERAKHHRIPLPKGREVHYRVKDTVALLMAGVSFARTYW